MKTDTAPNTTLLDGKDAKYYIQPYNLLDNSNFEIAQAGYKEKHGSKLFLCDRWECHTDLTVVKNAKSITVKQETSSTADYVYMWQYFNLNMDYWNNKTLTFAIKINGVIYIVNAMATTEIRTGVSKNIGNSNNIYLCIEQSGNHSYCQINLTKTIDLEIEWAVLYEGTYTEENLPPYVPKGYAVELAECRRYYRKFKNFICIALNSNLLISQQNFEPMRVIPSIKLGERTANHIGVGDETISITDYISGSVDSVPFIAVNGTLVAGERYNLYDFELNADL